MEKLRVHIDPKGMMVKPNDREWASITRRIFQSGNVVAVTVRELGQKIRAGHTVCPAIMDGSRASDWQEQQVYMVDIDNADETQPHLPIKQALAICEENNLIPAIYYQTFGYSKERQKYRLVFIMDKPVPDPQERYIIANTLVEMFPQSDKNCINANRYFAGTNRKVILHNENARVSLEAVMAVPTPHRIGKHHSAKTSQAKMRADLGLDPMIRHYDFLTHLIARNGEYRESGNIVYFKNCEICGHKDDLRYYKDTNTFYCFSSDGETGGSIIQYLMITEGLTLKEAKNRLKFDLCDPKWSEPTPFDEYNLPQFPVEQLPPILRTWVEAVAVNTATPVDMAAVSALAVVASTVQGKYVIEGKVDYTEPLNIYVLIIANSGERKSQIVKIMTKDILKYEDEENKRRKPEIEQWQNKYTIKQQQLDKAISKGDAKLASQLRTELSELETNMPKYLRLIADDVTPEALTSLLAENNGTIAVFSTEGGFFDIFSGMYNKKGANIDTLLKAHEGGSIRVDRKGREHEKIDKPALTMLLAAQKSVLEGVLNNPVFTGRGLTARFLYSIPTSLMGSRPAETDAIPSKLKAKYKKLIFCLLKIPMQDNRKPYYLKLDADANAVQKDFFNWVEPQLIGELADMKGWSPKLSGMALRIAGILHCITHFNAPHEHLVSADTMNRAIAIGKYFLEHAKYTFSLMGADKNIQDAKYILRRLEGQNELRLKISEIQRLCKHFKKQAEMQPALELLMEYGYIKMKFGKKDTGGRPEGIYYELNPLHFGE